ncbi:MAG: hypothetical protein ABJB34_05310 [Acidobacteriota bacterium]
MEKHRRIEITTFRRRLTIVSGEFPAVDPHLASVSIYDTGSQEAVAPGSDEVRRLLADAIRMLEDELGCGVPTHIEDE